MRRAIILALAVCTVSAASAEPRSVGAFSSVEAQGNYRVEIVMGDRQSVEIEGPDASRIAARVRGEELVLTTTDRRWFGDEPELDALVRVTTPRIESLQASRGAQLTATGIRATELNLDATMGGLMNVSGVCTSLDATAAMGGLLRAEGLTCTEARASASMGGSVSINATRLIDANASMGGDINVGGGASERSQRAFMGGSISIH